MCGRDDIAHLPAWHSAAVLASTSGLWRVGDDALRGFAAEQTDPPFRLFAGPHGVAVVAAARFSVNLEGWAADPVATGVAAVRGFLPTRRARVGQGPALRRVQECVDFVGPFGDSAGDLFDLVAVLGPPRSGLDPAQTSHCWWGHRCVRVARWRWRCRFRQRVSRRRANTAVGSWSRHRHPR